MSKSNIIKNRHLGCLLGLAVGDAVGTTLEFKTRGSFTPIDDMLGGGVFNLNAGEWTDDTSMALCLAESLIKCDNFNPTDQIQRYCRWWREGYLSSTGDCFDIGVTVKQALSRFEQTDEPYSGSIDPYSAGNGSLMRLAPIPMRYYNDMEQALKFSKLSSKTTHGALESILACQFSTYLIITLLKGIDKETAVKQTIDWATNYFGNATENIAKVFSGSFINQHESQIKGSGYVVESLEAALWAFYKGGTYRESILLAANLGDDADTTAAIVGQFSGAYYGVDNIPKEWLSRLVMKTQIEEIALKLFKLSTGNNHE